MKKEKTPRKPKEKKIRRHKISRQLAIVSALIMAASMVVCCVVNAIFLDDFYIMRKREELYKMHDRLVAAAADGSLQSEAFSEELEQSSIRSNTEIIVVDNDSETIIYSGKNAERMQMTIFDQIFLGNGPSGAERILEKTDDYQISISNERRTDTEYIEMWGELENEDIFLIRTPMESITESARMANVFLIYTGLFIILLTSIVILFVTRRITRPILNLANISDRVRHLDFDAKYEGRDKNEIGLLGDNINKMSESLEQTISELKTANNELRKDIERKDKFEEMRSEFVSNVSHELKTPIAIIQGYAEGLMEGISDDKESRDYYCSVIYDETVKMNHMVRQLLTLNELEMGEETIKLERFDIMDMIRNRMQATEIIAQDAPISTNLYGPEHLDVWSDEFKTEEVFTNFFSNAINHCSKERIIDVTVEKIGSHARITVFNTGDNIPEESLEHLFEKFYKVDKARTREYGGSGIGLSIVKAIQDSLGQDYGVENRKNGVAFYFELDAQSGNEE